MSTNDNDKNKQKPKEEEITVYGLIGKYDNKNIFFNQGSKYGDYLTHDNINYSIPECFKPLTLSKAVKIVSFKLNKKQSNVNTNEEIKK